MASALVHFVEKASQSSHPQARSKYKPFSPAACTPEKTLLSPQVWALSAENGQSLRAVGCIRLEKAAKPLFRRSKKAEAVRLPLSLVGFTYLWSTEYIWVMRSSTLLE